METLATILVFLSAIGVFVYYIHLFAQGAAISDAFKHWGDMPHKPLANFDHPRQMKIWACLGYVILIAAVHRIFIQPHFMYYLLSVLAVVLFWVPIFDGSYYVKKDWCNMNWNCGQGTYYGGFWKGVDTNPANNLMKELNRPGTRKMLFVFAIFILTIMCSMFNYWNV